MLSATGLFTGTSFGARILQSNDDGWAELYVRSFNDALNAAGHDVVLSCPADNKSGSSELELVVPDEISVSNLAFRLP